MTGTAASTPPLLVRGLRKRYADVVAVDGLDLEIRTGECFGLLGPNGAGKTTTIEICEGLTEPDEGEVQVLGRRWGEHDRELRELLGISLQETQFSEKLTVEETVRLFRSFYRRGPYGGRGDRDRPAPGEARRRGSGSSPAASGSGWRSPARWSATPTSSFSTSRPPASTRSRAGSSGS